MVSAQDTSLLGLPWIYSAKDVNQAYRNAMRKAHPDLHGSGNLALVHKLNSAKQRVLEVLQRREGSPPADELTVRWQAPLSGHTWGLDLVREGEHMVLKNAKPGGHAADQMRRTGMDASPEHWTIMSINGHDDLDDVKSLLHGARRLSHLHTEVCLDFKFKQRKVALRWSAPPPPAVPTTAKELGLDVLGEVVSLTRKLNKHFSARPLLPWMLDISNEGVRTAAEYDKDADTGLRSEVDHGNFAGSVLMLAMLRPKDWGSKGAEHLTIFGAQPPEGLVHLQAGVATSGKGADNRRTNVIEALLNAWNRSSEPAEKALRADLLYAWKLIRLTLMLAGFQQGRGWNTVAEVQGVWHRAMLPSFEPSEDALDACQFVLDNVHTQQQAQAILAMNGSDADWYKIKQIFGLTKNGSLVSTLWHALRVLGPLECLTDLLRLPPGFNRF